jgi:predicted nicotinamide N-methyase
METDGREKVDIWKKVKDAIVSKHKLVLLSKFDQVEMNLFNKSIESHESHTQMTLTLNSEIGELMDKVDLPIGIKLVKRNMTDNEADYLKYEIIDNTGNIAIWPSEEILAVFVLLNRSIFKDKRVLELGTGFSGLSGLMVSMYTDNECVLLTDGNTRCIHSLFDNIKVNNLNKISAKFLLWNRFNSYEDIFDNEDNQYDIILLSDCLFFKNYHDDLVHTINSFLRKSGVCIIVTPSRGKTMSLFLEKAEPFFNIYVSTKEIDFIKLTLKEPYEPYYIELRKK